jgi:hypothetical protein
MSLAFSFNHQDTRDTKNHHFSSAERLRRGRHDRRRDRHPEPASLAAPWPLEAKAAPGTGEDGCLDRGGEPGY